MTVKQTFKKQERLCSKKQMGELIAHGKSFYEFPFRAIWTHADDTRLFPVQVAFAVPKRKFKRAVHRNLIRRRIKEAYRLNKETLYESLRNSGKSIDLLIVYSDKEIKDFKLINTKIIVTLNRLIKEIKREQGS